MQIIISFLIQVTHRSIVHHAQQIATNAHQKQNTQNVLMVIISMKKKHALHAVNNAQNALISIHAKHVQRDSINHLITMHSAFHVQMKVVNYAIHNVFATIVKMVIIFQLKQVNVFLDVNNVSNAKMKQIHVIHALLDTTMSVQRSAINATRIVDHAQYLQEIVHHATLAIT